MVRVEELPFMFMYTGHIYQFFAKNQEPLVARHLEDLLERGLVSIPNLSDGGDEAIERRRNSNAALRHLFDQAEYLVAMSEAYKGMRRFA